MSYAPVGLNGFFMRFAQQKVEHPSFKRLPGFVLIFDI
jgi:hypothetical protein